MAIDSKDLNLSRWETQLFQRREQIEGVKRGLYKTVAESFGFILLLLFLNRQLSKGLLLTAFIIYIGLSCLARICYGISAIGYKRIICQLMTRLDEKKRRG